MTIRTQAWPTGASKEANAADRPRMISPPLTGGGQPARTPRADPPSVLCGNCRFFERQLGVLPYCAYSRITVMAGLAPCDHWRPCWEDVLPRLVRMRSTAPALARTAAGVYR